MCDQSERNFLQGMGITYRNFSGVVYQYFLSAYHHILYAENDEGI